MIVRFTTRAGALTMHGDSAVALLRALGHSGTVPGAILSADLPAALARLRKSLETTADAPAPAPGEADEEPGREDAPPPVTLRMRAVPLVDMIETAVARDSDLMWERG